MLAQTIGIVSAKSYCITPFATIMSSLNIRDDTAAEQSLFKAEVLRAQNLITALKRLPKGCFAFFIIDELFTGSSPEKCQAAAYQLACYLADFSQLCYLWATHYQQLTHLEQNKEGICKNYKMEAYKDDVTGRLIRPFKLDQGISSSNIASEILESELGNTGFFDHKNNIYLGMINYPA